MEDIKVLVNLTEEDLNALGFSETPFPAIAESAIKQAIYDAAAFGDITTDFFRKALTRKRK